MAVLIEGVSVVVRMARIVDRYPGGWQAFRDDCPNGTLCSDASLARVGFMSTGEADEFIGQLTAMGLVHLDGAVPVDIAIVDQMVGPAVPCDWIEVGKVTIDGNLIGACWMKGDQRHRLMLPDGWDYENSLTRLGGFVPAAQEARRMEFLRHEGDVDIYFDRQSGSEVIRPRRSP